jgi:UDP-N-acetylglucosamine 2-epimerase (non-hydrolysing)
MKIAPLYHALNKESWAEPQIVHTGQHYDLNMSDVFFQDLKLPEPHIHLGVGSGSHAEQTGQVMMAYEGILIEESPDLVIVVGDVNSTVACTMAAVKIPESRRSDGNSASVSENLNYDGESNQGNEPFRRRRIDSDRFHQGNDPDKNKSKESCKSCLKNKIIKSNPFHNQIQTVRRPLVGHLEAGLRSFDRTMPEEINRLVTDSLADILWTPSPDGDENLTREGIAAEKIDRVGNIMIDSLEMLRGVIEKEDACSGLGLQTGNYGLLTLHRPSNVDDPEILAGICQKLIRISQKIPLVFPVHPRTRKNIEKLGLMPDLENAKQMLILEPLNYIRFMNLVFNCRFALTDSGGIQEETSYLGIPCLTLRPNTERPITITAGTNRLCTTESFETDVDAVLAEPIKRNTQIDLWDGQTASRVVESIKKFFEIK